MPRRGGAAAAARDIAADHALASGWLAKRGTGNKSFKKRFSILRNTATFSYYGKDSDSKPLGVVDAAAYVAVQQSGSGSGGRTCAPLCADVLSYKGASLFWSRVQEGPMAASLSR